MVKALQKRVGIYVGPQKVCLLLCTRSLQGRLTLVSKVETTLEELANFVPLEWRGARAYVAVSSSWITPLRLNYPKGVLPQLSRVLPYDLQTHLPEGEEGTYAYSVVEGEEEAAVQVSFLSKGDLRRVMEVVAEAGLKVGGMVPSYWALLKAVVSTGQLRGEGGYTVRENGDFEGVLLDEGGSFMGLVPSSPQLASMVLGEVGEYSLEGVKVEDTHLDPCHLLAYGALLAGEDPKTPAFDGVPFKVERSLPLHLVFYLVPPLVLVLLTFLISLPIKSQQEQLVAKKREFKKIKVRLDKLEAESRQKERLEAMIKALSSFRAETGPKKIDVLQELTERLPESAWVSNLTIRGKKMTIRGQAASAISLINALEESPMFSHVHFISSVTKNKRTGKEYFNIQLDIVSPGGGKKG